MLIATIGLLSSLSILFVVSTIVGVLSVVIAVVVLRRYVQQATKEACVRECEERSEAFCFCYDKPKIHIMQLTKHPTYLPGQQHSFITHQLHAFDGHPSVEKRPPVALPQTVEASLLEQTDPLLRDPDTSSLRSASRSGWSLLLPMHTLADVPAFTSLDAHSFVRIELPKTCKDGGRDRL